MAAWVGVRVGVGVGVGVRVRVRVMVMVMGRDWRRPGRKAECGDGLLGGREFVSMSQLSATW